MSLKVPSVSDVGQCGSFARWWCVAASLVLSLAATSTLQAEVTAKQVSESIISGVAFLTKQQKPTGNWTDYDGQPTGTTALCALALLNCGEKIDAPALKGALAYLEEQPDPQHTYAASLQVMLFALADPVKYKPRITRIAHWLEAHQVTEGETKGGWSYSSRPGRSDNSNTQFAMLALHEAEKVGVPISDRTWQLSLNYWLAPGMQKPDGAWGYEKGHPETGSMTCAGVASVIIAMDRLRALDASVVEGRIQCCQGAEMKDPIAPALAWLGNHFTVSTNPNTLGLRGVGQSHPWLLYYLYGVERVGRMTGNRYLGEHDWYREGCEFLVDRQRQSLNGSWQGTGIIENDPVIGTCLALLFLSKGRRPVVLAQLKHGDGALDSNGDWNSHRRSVQQLVSRVEKQWRKELSWQTINLDLFEDRAADKLAISTVDLLEAPVLFLSGRESLKLTTNQKKLLREYIDQGGFLFAEACDGSGCDGAAFDRDFRALMSEIFPESELRRLPPDHAIWFAQEVVNAKDLPGDKEFWLWGLDACCRTSVVYCPKSMSCYWELHQPSRIAGYTDKARGEVEACTKLGGNILAYATNRQLKEKLERPQLAVTATGGKSPRGALVIPKLSHGGGSDDAPNSLANLLVVMNKQLEMTVDFERRMYGPADEQLLDHPIVFAHGRRSFRFTAVERQAMKAYLDRGGFLFADAICASPEFTQSVRDEMRALYPEANWIRLPASHPMFSDEYFGFRIGNVTLRDPQARGDGDPLTAKLVTTAPLLEAIEIDGRIAVVLSPWDISCALEKGQSLECKGYLPADAARIAANVILYALGQ
jgi:hypothetical protein